MEKELKYKSLSEFKKAHLSEYMFLYHQGLVDRFCKDMEWSPIKRKNPRGYWNVKENCLAEARKYSTLTEWCVKKQISYTFAKKNGWFDECIEHMERVTKPDGYWTKERCIEDALKYNKLSEWSKNGHSSFSSAKRNNWRDECTKHMVIRKKKPNNSKLKG